MAIKWHETDAADLPREDVRTAGRRYSYAIPKGMVGEADGQGRRKVVWQRSEKKIYVVCPGCGTILHYPLESSVITGKDIFTAACIHCRLCGTHDFVLLKGAAQGYSRLIKKEPEKCPCCRKPDLVERHSWEYAESQRGCGYQIYAHPVLGCRACSVFWGDPEGKPKLLRSVDQYGRMTEIHP